MFATIPPPLYFHYEIEQQRHSHSNLLIAELIGAVARTSVAENRLESEKQSFPEKQPSMVCVTGTMGQGRVTDRRGSQLSLRVLKTSPWTGMEINPPKPVGALKHIGRRDIAQNNK